MSDDPDFPKPITRPRCPQFGRYQGESGHGGYERRLPFLTHQRHRWLIIAVMHNRVFADRRERRRVGLPSARCVALAPPATVPYNSN
jgi:hypothetical protein